MADTNNIDIDSEWQSIIKDPDREFRIPPSDAKGHHEHLGCKAPPALSAQIGHIVESKFFPYKTRSDVVRHAVYRHCKWLVNQAPIPSFIGQIEIQNEILLVDALNIEMTNTLQKAQDQIATHVSNGDSEEAARLAAKIKASIGAMPEGHLKLKCQEQAERRFGYIKVLEKATELRPDSFIKEG